MMKRRKRAAYNKSCIKQEQLVRKQLLDKMKKEKKIRRIKFKQPK